MPPETLVQPARKTSIVSNSSSDLSSAPSSPLDPSCRATDVVEEAAQAAVQQRREQEAGKAGTLDEEDGTEEDELEDSNDAHPPNSRRSALNVCDIERELQLSAAEGRQLHDMMRDEMKNAGILGAINFSSRTRAQSQQELDHIIETAKRELMFLKEKIVETDRLDTLLLARLRIVNRNEKHNNMMVRIGKVHARAGESRRTSSATESLVEEAQVVDAGVETAPTTQRPSILAAVTHDLGNGLQQDAAVGDEERTDIAQPSINVMGHQTTAHTPTFRTDIFQFHPTVFLIRIVKSTTGAAVHTSHLMPTPNRGSVTSIDDVSYKAFIENVNHQVGFDVRRRISAVVPKSLGCGFMPVDATIKLVSEEEWKAVLQLWQNAHRKTCEFVVDELVEE